nr:isoform 2 of sperm-associated antigen 1 [Quercus suber]
MSTRSGRSFRRRLSDVLFTRFDIDDALQQQKALEQANGAKLEGNKLFGDGQFEEALSQYELALQVAPDMPSSSELRSICHANRAICYSKLMSSRINIHHPHQIKHLIIK